MRLTKKKWIKYTNRIITIPIRKCTEVGDECNSIIKTIGVDQAWWDMQYGNWIPSWWHR